MKTCKDCIHYNVCRNYIDEETPMTVNECIHGFKHKEQYTRLPFYVDQKVFKLRTEHEYINDKFTIVGYEIVEGKVSTIQQKSDKSWKAQILFDGYALDYTVEAFNKYIFYTREAAEAIAEESMIKLKKGE